MYRVVPFKVEHIDLMWLRKHEETVLSQIERIKALEKASIAVTGVVDGRIVLCGGVMPYVGGTADVWLIPSMYLRDYAKTAIPKLKEWLFARREELSLQRLESTCVDDDLHDRWMEWLGFEKEGIKKKFYMGVDYAMWGKTWE